MTVADDHECRERGLALRAVRHGLRGLMTSPRRTARRFRASFKRPSPTRRYVTAARLTPYRWQSASVTARRQSRAPRSVRRK